MFAVKLMFRCYRLYEIRSLVIILRDGVRVVPLLHGNGDAYNRADSIVPLFGQRPKV
jgi:hypothetical protein